MEKIIKDIKQNVHHLREHVWMGWSMFSGDGTRRVQLMSVLDVIVQGQSSALRDYNEHVKTYLKEKGDFELCAKLDKDLEAILYEIKDYKGL